MKTKLLYPAEAGAKNEYRKSSVIWVVGAVKHFLSLFFFSLRRMCSRCWGVCDLGSTFSPVPSAGKGTPRGQRPAELLQQSRARRSRFASKVKPAPRLRLRVLRRWRSSFSALAASQ